MNTGHSQSTQASGVNEPIQFQPGKKERPRRAKWACFACHKRKVRCDALNQGTSCTNCKLDMKECVAPPPRKKAPRSPYIPGEDRTDGTLSPCMSQHSAISDPTCNGVQSISTGVSRKRKRQPRSLDSLHTKSKRRPDEGSHKMNNEVGLWMDMLPPNVLKQLELHSTGTSRPHRDIDGLNAEQFHTKCSEKLLQAVDILTEVIILHNSLSAHRSSGAHSANMNCASENQFNANKGDTEYSFVCQDGKNNWDEDIDESSALTAESLEYVAGSNFNIWLELNGFDLESPSHDV
ncbi:hypothetical protein N7491_010232 [Penicillium cf. griseofulvum]|uniref:Zn(2)-C6 fungal-type domain-containing protein n=1 Tax=Penicillium cf. griseofulvum TaxID=2972120 RepID=A0A9W9T6K1_9EURO|nr:hypothetical protein N7472_000564 [Penicillium cf. griseofulvum]KAJ5421787.1 hypothetical protein N7491_010232 [Penicillium cf. griseofulvum]KAJ5427979.1 hypothetical protein N7445_009433 [Penicillium cf. griseofulvum]